jgi:hypothetical protein
MKIAAPLNIFTPAEKDRMKKALLISAVCIVAGIVLLFLGEAYFTAQRADYGWNPPVERPEFSRAHPRVLIDEGHNNTSAGFTGRYWPFARLLRADGYTVVRGAKPFTPAYLAGAQVLVVVNASGESKKQIFGINIPIPGGKNKQKSDPPFTAAEIAVVQSWVERGGSLLLVADHAPFGEAAAGLSAAFGVTMHKGFVEVPDESSDPLLFSKENGRLGDHPVFKGSRPGTAVDIVMTYTGQSLDGPDDAAVLLRLPPTAVEYVPDDDTLAERPAGTAQGLALTYGSGRVVVLGEGAMLTAQVNRRVRYGMNTSDNDNRRFVLNVMHWLSRRI